MAEETKKNFPAPKKEAKYVEYWEKLLPKIVERDNFHNSHLDQLSILCDLYVEYSKLSRFIKKKGYTYASDGRYGIVYREYPEVKLRDNAIKEIRSYSKLLGLVLAKDTSMKESNEQEQWD